MIRFSSLETYKQQFIEFDLDSSGDIDLMELKMMMENMGKAKTHLGDFTTVKTIYSIPIYPMAIYRFATITGLNFVLSSTLYWQAPYILARLWRSLFCCYDSVLNEAQGRLECVNWCTG